MRILKEVRTSQFITQSELAALAGVSVVTIRRLEGRKQTAKFRTVKLIAKALKVKPQDIEW